MKRDKRILSIKTTGFRVRLCLEDLVVTELIEIQSEKVGVFILKPIVYTDIGLFYRIKLKSKSEKYFAILCQRLAYLNEGISEFGLKKLAEYCLYNFVEYKDKEYTISNEEMVYGIKLWLLSDMEFTPSQITRDLVVAYSRDSKLTANQKREITQKARNSEVARLTGELIHAAVMMAIEQEPEKLIITNARVLPYCGGAVKTTKTMVRRAEERSVVALQDINVGRPFRSDITEKKYQQYVELPIGTSSNKASRRLRVSKSTISQFKKIKDGI